MLRGLSKSKHSSSCRCRTLYQLENIGTSFMPLSLRQREGLVFCLFLLTLFLNYVTHTSNIERRIDETVDLISTEILRKEKFNDTITSAMSIRDWGCDLTETPFIFVHIGKSGGGSARARFAASALDYSRGDQWQNDRKDKSYYPVGGSNNKSGFFCNAGHPQHRVRGPGTMEKSFYCHATTPLGNAIACPEPLVWHRGNYKRCNFNSDECPVVYTGHNLLGNEMNWLPQPYLSKWWEKTFLKTSSLEHEHKVHSLLKTLAPDNPKWCPLLQIPRPKKNMTDSVYIACSTHLAQLADKEAFHVASGRPEYMSPSRRAVVAAAAAAAATDEAVISSTAAIIEHPHEMIDWSPVYASLPLLRVTLIRDPYSWFMSKFFWHNLNQHSDCDDVDKALRVVDAFNSQHDDPDDHVVEEPGAGWLHRMAHGYLTYLCGTDCANREHLGTSSLQQMEIQASNNLRYSFAVVGLLNETDTFYKMVSARVQYLDTSLNPHVTGKRHGTPNNKEALRCKAIYNNVNFQAKLRTMSPVVAALDRIYNVALEVNRHQLKELQQCASFPIP